MASRRPSAQRLTQILERQGRDRFGRDYQPAIRATRAEAPPKSRPSMGFFSRIGRDLHFLSKNELAVAMLCLHHPDLFDLQEQKMLATEPRLHPFAQHPVAASLPLPDLKGTVDVAERLGCLSVHPMIRVRRRDLTKQSFSVPFPYLGDLLLFLNDALGTHLINFSVKDKYDDFSRSFKRSRRHTPEQDAYRAWARHEVERVYYADAGIPTMRVAASTDIDPVVSANLRRLFGIIAWPVVVTDDQRSELVHLFDEGFRRGTPPYDLFEAHQRKLSCGWQTAWYVLAHAIWMRRLRVDLFRPILPNHPLRPEERDVFSVYGHWFQRPSCTPASS